MSLTKLFIFVSKILKWTDMQTDLLSWVLVGESDALHWSLLKLWLPESPQEKICYRLLQDYYLNWMLKVFIFRYPKESWMMLCQDSADKIWLVSTILLYWLLRYNYWSRNIFSGIQFYSKMNNKKLKHCL